MSNITPSQVSLPSLVNITQYKWALGIADTGVGVQIPDFADKTVTITGTFGSATVIIIGSNDSTNGLDGTWVTMADPQGTAISKTSAAIKTLLENPLWVSCSSSGGTGSAITVLLTTKK